MCASQPHVLWQVIGDEICFKYSGALLLACTETQYLPRLPALLPGSGCLPRGLPCDLSSAGSVAGSRAHTTCMLRPCVHLLLQST